MKIIALNGLPTERIVNCPSGGFISKRLLLESDGMGYTVTETTIPPMGPQFWHYKNHLETCLCISGTGILTCVSSGEKFSISPGIAYVLDRNDPHTFEAIEEVKLVCVFNPPLMGRETHQKDGSYV